MPSARSPGIRSLPEDLIEAIRLAADSEVLREALGDHVHEFLIRNKREEWDALQVLRHPVRDRAVPADPLIAPLFWRLSPFDGLTFPLGEVEAP